MTDFDMPEPTKLMIAGDWHSNSKYAIKALKHARLAGCDTVLHLGDWGFWPNVNPNTWPPETGYYKGVMDYCRQSHLRFFWLDGNHENHELLNPGMGNDVIRHLPRGHRWEWWGKTWMAVGGGVSVDKKWRRIHIDWFPEETLTPRQWEYCMRDGKVDVIVSHDCPSGVAIPGIHAEEKQGLADDCPFPAEAIAESHTHRKLIAAIVEQTRPDYLFHGHYHVRYNSEYVYDGFDEGGPVCKIIGLDRDLSYRDHNTVILTAKDLGG